MLDDITKHALPEISASEHADELSRTLQEMRGQHLNIDASGVNRIDTPCLQVLLAAAKQWMKDGVALKLAEPSEAFEASIAMLGLSIEQFETESMPNV
ncbi:MAG: STAS domain-containing protein [Rhizobiaceae bacterium]|nr:STAS domain-containing protein [Rhizobiaceae bacterium]